MAPRMANAHDRYNQSQMRILHVITSLMTGGAETLVVNMVPRLRAMGHVVDVCVFNGRETALMQRLRSENPGIRIYKLGTGVYNPLYILKLAKIMRNYDIVHSHNSSPQLFVAIAGVLCSVGLCTTEHNTSNRKRRWKWYAPIESHMYSAYDHIVCISRIAEEKLREYMGGAWLDASSDVYSKISTINNGVDVEAVHNALPLPSEHKSGTFVTAMVAGFREAKDQDTAIRAIARLPEEYELWLVGDGERRGILEALSKKLGVENRVRFWGTRSDVPQILKTADAIVMSSHWEGLSLSNIEGMSAGKPFLASDVNGLREVTKGYGLLFGHEDAGQLAELLRKLHDNRAFYNATAETCYKRACDFNITDTVEKYNEVYRRIAEKRR